MLSNFLIKIIVFLLPTQLGLHFWPDYSRVAGIKIDYLSPTLYLVDILLVLLLLLNTKRIRIYIKNNLKITIIFLLFVLLNTLLSVSPLNTMFWWIRSILYLLTFIVLRLRNLRWEQIQHPLFCSTVLIVLLEIVQLVNQSSLGGIFYYLGERSFGSSTPGIGRLNLLGQEVLRPISTFSHANSLSGYLLIVFYLFSKKTSQPWQKIVPFVGILLTFSKTAIFCLAIIVFNVRPEITIFSSIILTIIQPIIHNINSNSQSLSDRLFFFDYQNKIMFRNIFTGVGLGGYIPSLGDQLPGSYITPAKLQPIHNLPYLMLTEIGIIGAAVMLFTILKKKVWQFITNPLVIGLIAVVLFTGVFDHYTWTLPQNKLILLIAFAIML